MMVVKHMKRWFVLVSLLLPTLMIGCVSDTELHRLQADTSSLQRQSRTQQQTVEVRVQQLSDRVDQFEQAQAATRRDVARAAAMADELRSQVQRLQGAVQETRHQMQNGTMGDEGAAPKLSNVETRIRALEKQLPVSP